MFDILQAASDPSQAFLRLPLGDVAALATLCAEALVAGKLRGGAWTMVPEFFRDATKRGEPPCPLLLGGVKLRWPFIL